MHETPSTTSIAVTRVDEPEPPQPAGPTFGEMLEELAGLSAGLVVVLLPALTLAVPGILLFFVLPAILLLALVVPLAVIAAVIAVPPSLLALGLRRRRRRTSSRSAAPAGRASQPVGTSGRSQVRDLRLG